MHTLLPRTMYIHRILHCQEQFIATAFSSKRNATVPYSLVQERYIDIARATCLNPVKGVNLVGFLKGNPTVYIIEPRCIVGICWENKTRQQRWHSQSYSRSHCNNTCLLPMRAYLPPWLEVVIIWVGFVCSLLCCEIFFPHSAPVSSKTNVRFDLIWFDSDINQKLVLTCLSLQNLLGLIISVLNRTLLLRKEFRWREPKHSPNEPIRCHENPRVSKRLHQCLGSGLLLEDHSPQGASGSLGIHNISNTRQWPS